MLAEDGEMTGLMISHDKATTRNNSTDQIWDPHGFVQEYLGAQFHY